MFFNYKNAKLFLDGREFACSNVSLTEESKINPKYVANERYTQSFAPQAGIMGQLSLTYYLTGTDYLKTYINNDTGNISGNFGGLSFNSGYLTSYSLRCVPNEIIKINANISFYDELKGIFTPTYFAANNIQTLNISNANVNNINVANAGDLSNLNSIQFDYSSEVTPVFTAGNTTPDRISFGKRELTTTIESDNLSGNLPVSGLSAGITLNLNHPSNPGITDSFTSSGFLFKRNISTSIGQKISSSLSIKQDFLANIPVVSSFSPSGGLAGSFTLITGSSFSTASKLLFNSVNDPLFKILSDTLISGIVPNGATTGPLNVVNEGGVSANSPNFTVTQPAIVVSGFAAYNRDSLLITGSSFYNISNVFFSGNAGLSIPGQIFSYTPSNIYVQIPQNTAWGKLKIVSQVAGLSSLSPYEFVPSPFINGFSPSSGVSGTLVFISGYSFSGITGVTFNNLYTQNPFTVIDNTGIQAKVPSGNVFGKIRLFGQSGVFSSSIQNFSPLIQITGVYPSAAFPNAGVIFYGTNFYPSLLSPIGNGFIATFGGVTGEMDIISSTQLSGQVPTGAKTGPVSLVKSDGSISSTGYFQVLMSAPLIASIYFPPIHIPGAAVIINTPDNHLIGLTGIRISGATGAFYIDPVNYVVNDTNNTLSIPIPQTTGGIYDVILNTTGGQTTITGSLQVLQSPTISGFKINEPTTVLTSGGAGTIITITGTDFYSGISHVYLSGINSNNGIECPIVSYGSGYNSLSFYVPSNTPQYTNVFVNNSIDFATGNSFTFIPIPRSSGFLFKFTLPGDRHISVLRSTLTGEIGDTVQLSGSNFSYLSGISIGSVTGSFTQFQDTGLFFGIPPGATSDYVNLFSLGGNSKTNFPLYINYPALTFSGFRILNSFFINQDSDANPPWGSPGEVGIISGIGLSGVSQILFTGITGLINSTLYSGIGDTGILFTIPQYVNTGNITLISQRGSFISTRSLNIPQRVTIDSITNNQDAGQIQGALIDCSGAYNEVLFFSGLNYNPIPNFIIPFFQGATGSLVRPISPSVFSTTQYISTTPREIKKGTIIISGFGSLMGLSSGSFTPLPTILGINGTRIATGQIITITGINCLDYYPYFGITGGSGPTTNIFDFYTGNFNQITGVGVNDSTTGYSIFSGTVNSTFVGTGRLFMLTKYDSNRTALPNYIRRVWSSQGVTLLPSAPVIDSISPLSGNTSTLFSINGNNLLYVTGAIFISGNYRYPGALVPLGTNSFLQVQNTGVVPSGQIQLTSSGGSAVSSFYFTNISQPIVSGCFPTMGMNGSNFVLSGSSLKYLTGIYFAYTGNISNLYGTTYNTGSDSFGNQNITGKVPAVFETLPNQYYIIYKYIGDS